MAPGPAGVSCAYRNNFVHPRRTPPWRCLWTPTRLTARSLDDVAQAHAADVQTQDAYGVHYLRSWVDQQHGKIFCLVDAPDADAAAAVHREAHGLVADEIYPVAEGA